jgi:tetratricopeptide (TPR) repeat protein
MAILAAMFSFVPNPVIVVRLMPRAAYRTTPSRLLSLFIVGAGLLSLSACTTPQLQDTVTPTAAVSEQQAPPTVTTPPAPNPPPEYANFTEDQLYRTIVAELALQRRQIPQALETYAALARETQNTSILQRSSRVAAIARQPNLAIEMAQLWLVQEPASTEARQIIALQLVTLSRFRDAFKQFEALVNAGQRVDFRLLSARIAATTNNGSTAVLGGLIDDYEALLRQHPKHDSLRLSLAHLYQLDKQPKPALALIQQMEKELESRDTPDTPASIEQEPLRAGDLVVLEVQLLDLLPEPKQALQRMLQGIKASPEHKELRYLYGRRLVNDRNYTEAKNQFAKLVELNPNDYDLLYSLALLSMEVNLYAEAKSYLQRLVLNGQRLDDVHYLLGFIEGQESQPQRAIEHYLLVKGGSNFQQTLRNLTELMVRAGRYEEVRSHLQNVRFRNAELNIPLLSMEANVLVLEKQYDQARSLLNSSILAFPNNVELLFVRSVLSGEVNDLPLMEADLRQIMLLEPQSPVAYNSLGYTLADRTTRYQEAYELIKKALELTPDDPAIIDSLGWVQYKLGLNSEAKTNLDRAYKLYPDAEVAAHLGEVLWVLGDKAAATKLWREALAKQPDSAPLRDTMQRFSATSTSAL